ncbi:hypothetical protein NDU88_003679 [Pleurodeles waltl]|uniref:Uncharacterized protein n=1 Tax=Pleurodeles waltl TaxID=8319 RepID=A0AAV7VI34_PLEWA|nr:hypothetical protein NDU88_003679 [Pleurodeles waltl]
MEASQGGEASCSIRAESKYAVAPQGFMMLQLHLLAAHVLPNREEAEVNRQSTVKRSGLSTPLKEKLKDLIGNTEICARLLFSVLQRPRTQSGLSRCRECSLWEVEV